MISSFELISETPLAEHNAAGYFYRHKRTGCQVFHIKNSDPENLFAFIFQTPVSDNCGTAHIMEHSVLAGSEHFPVKDPFLQLLKGSVYTFLNAMTYPDRTVYPASTVVEKDYFNLMKVYGDAVFFPLLRKETFMQEKTIVYNEMKGSYSDSAAVLDEYSRRSLFPDTAYQFDSGGMPDSIPDLTYEKFRDFHKKYYSPSNCRIFLYGNIDTEKQLEFLENEFLYRFDADTGRADCVPLQKKYDTPLRFDTTCPASEDADGSASVSWLCGESADLDYTVKARILSDILLDNPSSLLYRRIVESDIAEDVASVTGVYSGIRQTIFTVGVRGIEKGRLEEFEAFIETQLKDIAAGTIDKALVDAALSKADFRIKELKVRFGMVLLGRIIPGWLYRGSPTATLCTEQALGRLKAAYQADDRLFNKFIENELISGRHKSLVSVFPGAGPQERLPVENASEADIAQFEAYKKSTDSPEDLAKIPVLHRTDIPYDVEKPNFEKTELGHDTIYKNSLFTGGIVYTDLFFDAAALGDDQLIYMPLLCALLEEVGLPDMPYYDVASRMDTLAGSWFITTFCESCLDAPVLKRLMVHFAALEEKTLEAAKFLIKVLRQGQVTDLERVKNVIISVRNDLKEELLDNGNNIAMMSATEKFSESSHMAALWSGLPQLAFLEDLDTDDESQMKKIAAMLFELQKYIFSQSRIISVAASPGWNIDSYVSCLETLLVPESYSIAPSAKPFVPKLGADCYTTSAMVNFNSMAFKVQEKALDNDMVAEAVLSHILTTGRLWETVRMEGGAYGVSAMSDFIDHLFIFTSYRDPALSETFKAFIQSLAHTAEQGIKENILDQAIITMVGRDLRPKTPGARALEECVRDIKGLTWALKKKRRDILQKLTVHDIMEAASALKAASDKAALVTIAGRQAVEKEKAFIKQEGFKITDLSI
ncbi:MAG: insulinase family protein [Spirochaetia bacterium]|nr:insulinase family protein [Spirochaetia bacterium]